VPSCHFIPPFLPCLTSQSDFLSCPTSSQFLNWPLMTLHTISKQSETHQVKLLLLGAASVGKSSLLLRFTDQQWLPESEVRPTIGVDTWVRARRHALTSVDQISPTEPQARCEREARKPEHMGKCEAAQRKWRVLKDSAIGYCWRSALSRDHVLLLPWNTGDHPRSVHLQ
jgi:hypothetical protein